jgi:hypothetical protein
MDHLHKPTYNMTASEIASVVDKITPGTKLQIVFPKATGPRKKIDGTIAEGPLTSFYQMFLRKMFELDTMTMMILSAVIKSKYWEHDVNRTFIVTTTENFSAARFKTHVSTSIESISIVQ